MKLIALLGAGALVAGTMTVAATPAEAQRWGDRHGGGWHDRGPGGGGWHRGPGWDRGRHWGRDRGWGGRGYYGGGYGYRGGYGGYGRPRVVCRIVRGYYGPERRCFRR